MNELPKISGIEHGEYKVYEDPGHGWLRVPLEELKQLEIENEITSYSYMDNDYAYLEEDQDAGTYVNKRFPSDYERKLFYRMCETIYKEDIWIRHLPRFKN